MTPVSVVYATCTVFRYSELHLKKTMMLDILPECVLRVSLSISWGVLLGWACEGTQELLGTGPSGPHTSVERHLFWLAAGTTWTVGDLLSGRSKLSIRKLFPELPNPRCRDGDSAISLRFALYHEFAPSKSDPELFAKFVPTTNIFLKDQQGKLH